MSHLQYWKNNLNNWCVNHNIPQETPEEEKIKLRQDYRCAQRKNHVSEDEILELLYSLKEKDKKD
jgi:hypothetical protein